MNIVIIVWYVLHGTAKAEEKLGPNNVFMYFPWLLFFYCFKSIWQRKLLTIQKDIKSFPLSCIRLVYFRTVEHENQIGCTYDAQLGINR